MVKNNSGQVTLEYMLLAAAVLIVMIGFLGQKDSGFQKNLNESILNATASMEGLGSRLGADTAFKKAPLRSTAGALTSADVLNGSNDFLSDPATCAADPSACGLDRVNQ